MEKSKSTPTRKFNFKFLARSVLLIPALLFLKSTIQVTSSGCIQPEPFNPANKSLDNNYQNLTTPTFTLPLFNRFSGAVQIPTVTYDEMIGDYQDPVLFAPFKDFRKYLQDNYPLVHQLEYHIINEYSLIYIWQGSDVSLKPIMLMAHMDVVPVDPATVSEWSHPPFSGFVDEKFIWGRGATDCKGTVIGIIEAVESLLKAGFTPKRTIIVSFGHDEEISGYHGQQHNVEYIFNRYGADGIEYVLDEGGSIVASDSFMNTSVIDSSKKESKHFAIIGIAEKGYLDVNITVNINKGGHASIAPPHTGIGILAEIIVALEDNPHQPELLASNPVLQTLQCINEHTNLLSTWQKFILHHWQWFKPLILHFAKKNPLTNIFFATTQAADVVKGGVKVNALPQTASIFINHRVAMHQSVDQVMDHIYQIVAPIAAKHSLSFLNQTGNAGSVVVGTEKIEPSPISPTGQSFEEIGSVVKRVFPNTIISPMLMTANTDTRWVWKLTRNIYRFTPAIIASDDGIHTVNERISKSNLVNIVKFYHELVRASTE
ncbi:hypothetical protein HK103_002198 [Boothiomyces macroporosus]|uniref:Peptidase M20 dimerisation domain-containing protein n=1 Tax=Boothiomyces macroporosus TaxID=261099 RepID=A0AAD5U9T5_9FUNG|nr:hypothetical protein HK103_002198 [Boothiomyces macroporosus]